MSTTVDSRIVQAKFDNKEFEKHIRESIDSLNDFEKSLNMNGASSGLDEVSKSIKKLSDDVGFLANRFSVVGEVVHEFWYNMANKAISLVTGNIKKTKDMLLSMSDVKQYSAGFDKYEKMIGSSKTIMNNTNAPLEVVDKYLSELMWYADETSYSFADMTQSLSTLTAAGGDMENLVPMIEGIANATAFAGKGSAEFSRSIYNLNQSYNAGALQYMDWKSVSQAGVGSQQLIESFINAGKALGTLDRNGRTAKGTLVDIGNFGETLKEKWATKDVMEAAFGEFSIFTQGVKAAVDGDLDSLIQYFGGIEKLPTEVNKAFGKAVKSVSFNDMLNIFGSMEKIPKSVAESFKDTDTIAIDSVDTLVKIFGGVDKIPDEIYASFADAYSVASDAIEDLEGHFDKLGVNAFKSAQQCKTLTDVIDAIRDAISTSWTRSFKLIFGDINEATEMWTNFYDVVYSIVGPLTEAREAMIEYWSDMGGRAIMLEALSQAWKNLTRVLEAVKKGWQDVFPPGTNEFLLSLTQKFNQLTHSMIPTGSTLMEIRDITSSIVLIIESVMSITGSLFRILKPGLSVLNKVSKLVLQTVAALASLTASLLSTGDSLSFIAGVIETIKTALMILGGLIAGVGLALGAIAIQVAQLPIIQNGLLILMNVLQAVGAIGVGAIMGIVTGIGKLIDIIGSIKEKGFTNVFKDIANSIKDLLYVISGKDSTEKTKGVVGNLNDISTAGEGAVSFIDRMKGIIATLAEAMLNIWDLTADFRTKFQPLIDTIKDLYKNMTWGEVVGVGFAFVIAQIAMSFNGLLKSLTKLASSITNVTRAVSIFDFINNLKDNITKLNKTLEKEVIFNGIVKIAAAVAIMAAAIGMLALVGLIAPGEVIIATVAISALTVLIGAVGYFMAKVQSSLPSSNYGGLGVTLIGIAGIILSVSMLFAVIQRMEQFDIEKGSHVIITATLALVGVLSAIGAFAWFIGKYGNAISPLNALSMVLLTLAISIIATLGLALIAVATKLGNAGVLLNAAVTIGVVCAAIAAIVSASSKLNVKTFAYTIGVLTGLALVASAIATFGGAVSIEAFSKARDVLVSIVAVLGFLQLIDAFLPVVSTGLMQNLATMAAVIGVSLVGIASAIGIMAHVMTNYSIEQIENGIVVLVVSFAAVIAAIVKMNSLFPTVQPAVSGIIKNTLKIVGATLLMGGALLALSAIAASSHASIVAVSGMMLGMIAFIGLYLVFSGIMRAINVTGNEFNGIAAIGIGVAGIAAACLMLDQIRNGYGKALLGAGAILIGLGAAFYILAKNMQGIAFNADGLLKTATSVMILALAVDALIPAVAVFALFPIANISASALAVSLILCCLVDALTSMGTADISAGKLYGVAAMLTVLGLIMTGIGALFLGAGDKWWVAGAGVLAAVIGLSSIFLAMKKFVFEPLKDLKDVTTAAGILAMLSVFMISLGGCLALVGALIGNNKWAAAGVVGATIGIAFILNSLSKIIENVGNMPNNMSTGKIVAFNLTLAVLIGAVEGGLALLVTAMTGTDWTAGVVAAGVVAGLLYAIYLFSSGIMQVADGLQAGTLTKAAGMMAIIAIFLGTLQFSVVPLLNNLNVSIKQAVIGVGSVLALCAGIGAIARYMMGSMDFKTFASALAGIAIIGGFLYSLNYTIIPLFQQLGSMDPTTMNNVTGLLFEIVGAAALLTIVIGAIGAVGGPLTLVAIAAVLSFTAALYVIAQAISVAVPPINALFNTLNAIPDLSKMGTGMMVLAAGFLALGVGFTVFGPGAAVAAAGITLLTAAGSAATPVMFGLAEGIEAIANAWAMFNSARQGTSDIVGSIQDIGTSTLEGFQAVAEHASGIGEWISKSLAEGMLSGSNYGEEAGRIVGVVTEEGLRNQVDVHSFSDKFALIGEWIPISFGDGILSKAGLPAGSAKMMGNLISNIVTSDSEKAGKGGSSALANAFSSDIKNKVAPMAIPLLQTITSIGDKAVDKFREMGFEGVAAYGQAVIDGTKRMTGSLMKTVAPAVGGAFVTDPEERIYSKEEQEAWKKKDNDLEDIVKNLTDSVGGVDKSSGKASKSTNKLLKITDYAAKVIEYFKTSYMKLNDSLSDTDAYEQAKNNVQSLVDKIFELTATEDELKLTGEDRLEAVKESFLSFKDSVKASVGGSVNMLDDFSRTYDQTLKKMNKSVRKNVDRLSEYMQAMNIAKDFMPTDVFVYFVNAGIDAIDELEAYINGSEADQKYFNDKVVRQEKWVKESENLMLLWASYNELMNDKTVTDEEKAIKKKELLEKTHTLNLKKEANKQKEVYQEIAESVSDTIKSISDMFSDANSVFEEFDTIAESAMGNVSNLFSDAFSNANNIKTQLKNALGGISSVFSKFTEWEDTTTEDLKNALKNQMDLFNEFNDSADLSAQELLENMQSNLTGVSEWSKEMQALGERGLSDELMKKLTDLGPNGYEYVKAFSAMTEEELAQANSLYSDSLVLKDSTAETVSNSFKHLTEDNLQTIMDESLTKMQTFSEDISKFIEAGVDPERISKLLEAGFGADNIHYILENGLVSELNAALDQYSDIEKKIEKTADNVAGTMYQAAITKYLDEMTKFSQDIENLVASGLDPKKIKDLLNAGFSAENIHSILETNMVGQFSDAMGKLESLTKQTKERLSSTASSLYQTTLDESYEKLENYLSNVEKLIDNGLSPEHTQKLLEAGFSPEQIERIVKNGLVDNVSNAITDGLALGDEAKDKISNMGSFIGESFKVDVKDAVASGTTGAITAVTEEVAGKDGVAAKLGEQISESASNGVTAKAPEVTKTTQETVKTAITEGNLEVNNETTGASTIGKNFDTKIGEGISSNKSTIIEVIKTMIAECVSAADVIINNPDTGAFKIGYNLIMGIKAGIESGREELRRAVEEATEYSMEEAANNLANGLGEGLDDEADDIYESGVELVNDLQDGVADAADMHSPSKMTYEDGYYLVQGLANGIADNTYLAIDAARDLTDSLTSVVTSAASTAADLAMDALDQNITITPIIDLSDAEEKSAYLRSMFGYNGTSSVTTTIAGNTSRNIMANRANTTSDLSGEIQNRSGNSYNFTQNNYSPKALSRIDIYRQTRNQFSRMRDAVEGA